MVKVGQIYALPWSKTPIAVSCIEYTNETQFDWIYVISSTGVSDKFWRKTMENLELIAEYPTLQEAVDSNIFKGEN